MSGLILPLGFLECLMFSSSRFISSDKVHVCSYNASRLYLCLFPVSISLICAVICVLKHIWLLVFIVDFLVLSVTLFKMYLYFIFALWIGPFDDDWVSYAC